MSIFNNSLTYNPYVPHQVFTPKDTSHLFYPVFHGKKNIIQEIKDTVQTDQIHHLARYGRELPKVDDKLANKDMGITSKGYLTPAHARIDDFTNQLSLRNRTEPNVMRRGKPQTHYPLIQISDEAPTEDELSSLDVRNYLHDHLMTNPITKTLFKPQMEPISDTKTLTDTVEFPVSVQTPMSSSAIPTSMRSTIEQSNLSETLSMKSNKEEVIPVADGIDDNEEHFSFRRTYTSKPTYLKSVSRERFESLSSKKFESMIANDKLKPNEPKILKSLDYSYLQILRSRALMIANYLESNKNYSAYAANWKLLQKNLAKTNYLFQRLDESDSDVAFVIDKGDEIKFRIRDKENYLPLNVYQYVLYHEMAHMCTTELQHTKTFFNLLSILCFAAFENGLLNFDKFSTHAGYYNSDGVAIMSKESIQKEVLEGAQLLKDANPSNAEYYDMYIKFIKKM